VEDTWGVRDVPVLSAVVELLDNSYMVTVSDVAAKTGLELAEVARSLDSMDPTFVDFRKTETGGDPRFWYVNRVTPEARQAVGQWPTAEGLVDQLAKAFSDAADHEQDAERHYQLRQAAGLLGETVRDVAVRVTATITGPLASRPAAAGNGPAPSAAGGTPPGETPPGSASPGSASPGSASPGSASPGSAPPGGSPEPTAAPGEGAS
jgi:hypothetical protein